MRKKIKWIINLALLQLLFLFTQGCENNSKTLSETKDTGLNTQLLNEISSMSEKDQLVARNAFPPPEYPDFSQEDWENFKDSVYRSHTSRLKKIVDEYGYLGYDLVGKNGEKIFWLLVQHSDHDVAFQKDILELMRSEINKKNASPSHYGLLIDRILINQGKFQLYGTQVEYDEKSGQAIPKKIKDSSEVDLRRDSIGLPSLKIYLNKMTELHFHMNKKIMMARGIKEPNLYQ